MSQTFNKTVKTINISIEHPKKSLENVSSFHESSFHESSSQEYNSEISSKFSSCSSFDISPIHSGCSTPLQFHLEIDEKESEKKESEKKESEKKTQDTEVIKKQKLFQSLSISSDR